MNINSRSFSIDEVAKGLGIFAHEISILYSKYGNDNSQGYHEINESIKTHSGETLKPVLGYYVSINKQQECVYAEYSNSTGRRYSYVKYPGLPVAKQIREDQEEYKKNNINRSKTNMNDLITMSLSSLENLYDGLDEFKENITKECDSLEDFIKQAPNNGLNDAQSQYMCDKCKAIIANIRECINPTTIILNKLYDAIEWLKKNEFSL